MLNPSSSALPSSDGRALHRRDHGFKFTSLSAVQVYDFHTFIVVYNLFCSKDLTRRRFLGKPFVPWRSVCLFLYKYLTETQQTYFKFTWGKNSWVFPYWLLALHPLKGRRKLDHQWPCCTVHFLLSTKPSSHHRCVLFSCHLDCSTKADLHRR